MDCIQLKKRSRRENEKDRNIENFINSIQLVSVTPTNMMFFYIKIKLTNVKIYKHSSVVLLVECDISL